MFAALSRRIAKSLGWPSDEVLSVCQAARREARSNLADEAAKETLRTRIQQHSDRTKEGALKLLASNRDEFAGDRAYRLPAALMADEPVKPIRPAVASLFAREEELGRAPLGEAVMRLTELEPRLSELTAGPKSSTSEDEAYDEHTREIVYRDAGQRAATLLGKIAQHPDPLVRSRLALSVANYYLRKQYGKLNTENPNVSYFSAPDKTVHLTGTLIRGRDSHARR